MKIFFKYFLLTHLICIWVFFAQRWLSSMFIKDIFVSSTEMWILIFVNILLILSPFFAIWWHYFKNNPQYHHQIFKKIFIFLAKIALLYGVLTLTFVVQFDNMENNFKILIQSGGYVVFWLLVHEFFF